MHRTAPIRTLVHGTLIVALLAGARPAAPAELHPAKTGQTNSYASGDDGGIQAGMIWPAGRFSVSGECVTDTLSGLSWTRDGNLPGGPLTWAQALAFANSLDLCGHTDWRLPNVVELESLVRAGVPEVATWLNAQGFHDVQIYNYWTSTTFAGDTSVAWVVGMWSGYIVNQLWHEPAGPTYKTNGHHVWPVRGTSNGPARLWRTGQTSSYSAGDDGDVEAGASWPSPRFTFSGDCATDGLTGLVWPTSWDFPTSDWATAVGAANALTLCGQTDWRLPNWKELLTLVNYGVADSRSWLSGQGFDLPWWISYLWTSTTYHGNTAQAWLIAMYDGNRDAQTKTSTIYNVLPVRGRSACYTQFGDVPPGSAGSDSVYAISCAEVTSGCSSSPPLFCPASDVPRVQMAVFLVKAMGETPSSVPYNQYFDDVANDGFAPYVNRIAELGVTGGCAARAFCPASPVTRAQMAVFVVKAMEEPPSSAPYNQYFDDVADDGFAPYINRMMELGVTGGCGTRLYCPSSEVSRLQMAVFLGRGFLGMP
jgi:hypothetical protein